MIGTFKIIGRDCYLQTNTGGTLEKLPPLRWRWQFYFAFKQAFFGYVHFSEVREKAKKVKKKKQHCHASTDGECSWKHCPQFKDGEPRKTGRHCPLDDRIEEY